MKKSTSLILPVTYSLISSKALQEELIPLYSLPKESKVLFLYQGIHDTYLVQGSLSKFILRIYRAGWKTFEQVKAELQLLLFLKEQGLSVSYPIAATNAIFIHQINSPEGERYSVMFSYAQGEKLTSLSVTQAFQFGKLIAHMHLITQSKKIKDLHRDYSINSILKNSLQITQTVLHAYPEALKKLAIINGIVKKKLTPLVIKELKTGICHGDPHFENIFIEPVANRVTIYDFDFSGNGYLLYDVGSFCFYERNSETNIKSFLEGYTQLMPLTNLELALVPYFKVLMRLFHLGARSKNADGIKSPLWFPNDIIEKINDIEKEVYSLRAKPR